MISEDALQQALVSRVIRPIFSIAARRLLLTYVQSPPFSQVCTLAIQSIALHSIRTLDTLFLLARCDSSMVRGRQPLLLVPNHAMITDMS